ncbi:hypothetical protein [Micromonospora chersina]
MAPKLPAPLRPHAGSRDPGRHLGLPSTGRELPRLRYDLHAGRD